MAKRLTDESYWDSNYAKETAPSELPLVAAKSKGLAHRILRRLSGTDADITRMSFTEYYLWNIVLPQHLVPNPEATVLEVGSAPGTGLIRFFEQFRHQPFGVEYTKNGADANRRTFAAYGLNPEQVLESDFFDEGFQAAYRERFDVVMSRGFIEHFTDVDDVIAKHVALLRPGGHLVITIPNLSGLNYYMAKKYSPELIPLHNLSIMNLPTYRKLFDRPELERLHIDYLGGLFFLMGDVSGVNIPAGTLKLLRRLQVFANVAQVRLGPFDSQWTSPQFVYVGRKRRRDTDQA